MKFRQSEPLSKYVPILSLFLSLFLSCQTATPKVAPSLGTIKTIIDSSEGISEPNRKIIDSSLRDLQNQIEAQARGYDELHAKYEALLSEYNKLQENYADSQKDAGWKDLLLWAFWGAVGVFCLYHLASFGKKLGIV